MAERKRKANKTKPAWRPRPKYPDRTYHWRWPPHLQAQLQPFSPGKSGELGGHQRLTNRLWAQTNAAGICWCNAEDFLRCQHYCLTTGKGGPNDLLRRIIPPVFRETFGIELSWPTPGQEPIEPDEYPPAPDYLPGGE